jgi:hypothetical protein
VYGAATLGWTQVLKKVADRIGSAGHIFAGGVLLAAGHAAGVVDQGLVGISLAAFFVGGGFAFMHSTLQTWATEVVPEARATVISFFAALFVGSGLVANAAAPLAERGPFDLIFALATLVALPLGVVGGLARRRYARK